LPLEDEEESSEAALAAEEHDDGNSWFYDIRNYLKDRSFPSYATSKDKEIIRRIATRYVILSHTPNNKRSFMMILSII
jgi:hypothetical protein